MVNTKELTEHEVRRHAKAFVDIYLAEGQIAAGKYGLENMLSNDASVENLDFWKKEIIAEFDRQGYILEDEDTNDPTEAA